MPAVVIYDQRGANQARKVNPIMSIAATKFLDDTLFANCFDEPLPPGT